MSPGARPERVWMLDPSGYSARWYRSPGTLAAALNNGYLDTPDYVTEYVLRGSDLQPRDLQAMLAAAAKSGPEPEMDWTSWSARKPPTPAQLADRDRYDGEVRVWHKALQTAYIDAIG